ncbi:septum site-determining protein Ssd [Phytoactinopolyspora limicola]|uniref:septum site-determining protein Ssd n=1 Tax=Phytoactinopolyspora limicola TaxID=2715536 RepID=UPI001A9C81E4|nr:septum site-determining protein Ssd [Phytoactinopolyspora limicola]
MDTVPIPDPEVSVIHLPSQGPRPKRAVSPARPRPLLITADDDLLDDLLRLAAAAGAEVDVASDPSTARSAWPTAPVVIIGDDQAEGLTRLTPTRRHDVYLIGRTADDPAVWRRGVALGAERVLHFPADEPWLTDRLADATEGETANACVVGVVGGRGGAGASVLATALSVTGCRRGLAVMLIDLDPLGGGLDLVLGAEDASGVRWPDLVGSRGRLSARALQTELPGRHGLTVLSWDRGDLLAVPAESARVVLAAARRGCDLVVLDLPRTLDHTTEEALSVCSTVVLVVPAEVRAVAAASRVAAALTTVAHDVRVVSRGPSHAGLDGSDVATALGLPLALHMGAERRLTEQLDRGETPGLRERSPLGMACGQLLDMLLNDHPASAA